MKNNQPYLIRIDDDSTIEMTLEEARSFDAIKLREGKYHLVHENKSFDVSLVDIDLNAKSIRLKVKNQIHTVQLKDGLDQLIDKLGFKSGDEIVATDVTAPMPGLVLDIMVEPGQTVEKDDPLIILEAMKMENVIKATGSAVIKEVLVEKQQKLEKGQSIITFE